MYLYLHMYLHLQLQLYLCTSRRFDCRPLFCARPAIAKIVKRLLSLSETGPGGGRKGIVLLVTGPVTCPSTNCCTPFPYSLPLPTGCSLQLLLVWISYLMKLHFHCCGPKNFWHQIDCVWLDFHLSNKWESLLGEHTPNSQCSIVQMSCK